MSRAKRERKRQNKVHGKLMAKMAEVAKIRRRRHLLVRVAVLSALFAEIIVVAIHFLR